MQSPQRDVNKMALKYDQPKQRTNLKTRLKDSIKIFMMERGLWDDALESEIPNSVQKYNNYILIKDIYFRHPNWAAACPQLWQLISHLINGVPNIALYGKINNDAYRSPQVKVVYGSSNNLVEFVDNGILYTWPVDKVMFSQGNLCERHRIAKLDCRGQLVIDMFAGIGYFTLPYLKHAKAAYLLAFDWNPNALNALRTNLMLNGVSDRCEIFAGDVRITCPSGVADHVNMGLIPSCEDFWETGCRALKPTGGILRIHGLVVNKPSESNRTLALKSECSDKQADKCIKCVMALKDLTLHKSNYLITEPKNYFFMDLNLDRTATFSFLETGYCPWKKVACLQWGIHVTHCIANYLVNIHQYNWRVQPVYFSRIKNYAPHIYHVVIDLRCQPF